VIDEASPSEDERAAEAALKGPVMPEDPEQGQDDMGEDAVCYYDDYDHLLSIFLE
jgi:hypothetical protein